MQTVTLYVYGMHCHSCTVMITDILSTELPNVSVTVSLKNATVVLIGEINETADALASRLSEKLAFHGYSLSAEPQVVPVNWADFKYAVPIAIGVVGLFIALQKLGIVNLLSSGEVNYTTALIVGLIASVSTCMAVVGGLVLSMSANYAKGGEAVRPQLLFHISRLVAFFVLGGIVGAAGAALQLSIFATGVLSALVAIVLLILGLNLLDVTSRFRGWQVTLPLGLGNKLRSLSSLNHTLTPAILGVATFVLPCGFTQSMQLYALSTQSFTEGAMVMFMFALGTLPMLALLSFSSFSVSGSAYKGVFYKTAGLIVIFFALYNGSNALAVLGVLPPIFNF